MERVFAIDGPQCARCRGPMRAKRAALSRHADLAVRADDGRREISQDRVPPRGIPSGFDTSGRYRTSRSRLFALAAPIRS
jgi:hypothetical protein